MPTRHFAEEYNRLLTSAKDLVPGVDDHMWPKVVEIKEVDSRTTINVRYIELQTYVEIVCNLIPSRAKLVRAIRSSYISGVNRRG